MYEYKVMPVKQCFITDNTTLTESIITYLEDNFNSMAKEGWEFYKLEDYAAAPLLGCLPALFGRSAGNTEHFKFMIYRREKKD